MQTVFEETRSFMITLAGTAAPSPKEQRIRQIKNSPPIFIIGSQRSGTSFLYRLVQKYLKIGFGRDNGNFIRLQKLLPCYGDLEQKENISKLVKDIVNIPEFKKRFHGLTIDVEEFVENLQTKTYPEVVRRFYAEWADLKGNLRWGGKTPDYAMHAPELFELFPDAKLIHIIRDGRDVALSLFNLNWGPKSALFAARHWQERVRAAIAFGRKLAPRSYMELRYENLLQQPEIEFEHLVRFIEYEGDREEILTRFKREIGATMKRDNWNKWKKGLSPRRIKIFEQAAGGLLSELRYEIVYPQVVGKPVRIWQLASQHAENFLVKLWRGEGFKGLYEKTYRLVREGRLKLSS